MDKTTIDTALYRPINQSDIYDVYFPDSNCKSVFLGNGDTSFTLSEMKKWVKKYVSQTKLIAQKLKAASLPETISNIHGFLYNNIQYKIDQYEQQLKSPACAYKTRREGTDCKSYSIFASSILLNLGIKHFLRKVRQPNISPEYWTHVYVVVPTDQQTGKLNQGYHVVDATLSQNREVPYIEKKDLKMSVNIPHYGLASPGISTGCGYNNIDFYGGQQAKFSPGTVTTLGTSTQTASVETAISNFKRFLAQLKQFSSSNYAIGQLEAVVLSKLMEGSDPEIRITDTGIYVDKEFINLKDTFKTIRQARFNTLGATDDTTQIPDSAIDLIASLLPKDFISDTFGAVFANGFDLSCWNSAHSEVEAQQQLSNYKVPFLNFYLNALKTASYVHEIEESLNWLFKYTYILREDSSLYLKGNNWSSCSQKGIQKQVDYFNEFIAFIHTVAEGLTAKYLVGYEHVQSSVTVNMPTSITGYTKDVTLTKYKNNTIQHPQYTLTPLVDTTAQEVDIPILPEILEDASGKVPERPKQTAGFSTGTIVFSLLVVGGIALGAKALKSNY